MRIQPRQQLLETWKALVDVTFKEGEWQAGGQFDATFNEVKWKGGGEFDSVSEAQQLLCLMYPSTELGRFSFERPDRTDEKVSQSLDGIGGVIEIPRRMTEVLISYLERHCDQDGNPRFSGGNYFIPYSGRAEPTKDQLAIDVTESFALSLTLALSVLGFARTFREELTRGSTSAKTAARLEKRLDHLKNLASWRLTAAMVGLLRSFSVYAFDAYDDEGRVRVATMNQENEPFDDVVEELREALRDVSAGLRDRVTIGSSNDFDPEGDTLLFECGWSWGVIKGADAVDVTPPLEGQRDGVAINAPYLYFTTVALDSIADLFTERTRRLGLLDEEQQRLAQALQIRWDLTQRYWATLATFGKGRWPLEDIPWKATDDVESDYFSLLVSAIATREMVERRASDEELSRLGRVLGELANRGRIRRRPADRDPSMRDKKDPAVQLHDPGFLAELAGSDLGRGSEHVLSWTNADFSALLLKRVLGIATLISDIQQRREVLRLADEVWEHLAKRRLSVEPTVNLWDQPRNVFPSVDAVKTAPSWQHTLRVVECLVAAALLIQSKPPYSEGMTTEAQDWLMVAEHLYDQEVLNGGLESGKPLVAQLRAVHKNLGRARDTLAEQPLRAMAHILNAVEDLNALESARSGVK